MTDTSAPAQEPAPDRKAQLLEAFNAVETAPPAPVEAAPVTSEAEPTPEPEEPVWSRAPASWKKEHHETWSTMTPQAREYAWQREEEMKAGVEPLKTKAQMADAFSKAVEPYMPTIQGLGMDPIKAVQGLMDADYRLRTLPADEKKKLIAELAASYGVNLSEVEPSQAAISDPKVYALEKKVTDMEGREAARKQAEQDAADQVILAQINEFAPRAELFDDALPTMIKLLQGEVADGIEDAYAKAIRLDPALYEKAEQSLQAAADAKKRADADKAAKAAKASAVSVRSSTPGAPPPPKAQDRRSMLEEQFSGLAERF